MRRYFVKYIDCQEAIKRVRNQPEREIGKREDGTKIISALGSSPHDNIGSSEPFPEEMVGNVIIGVSKDEDGNWWMDRPLHIEWVGHRNDVPENVKTTLDPGFEYYATCPTTWLSFYAFGRCYGVAELYVDSLEKKLRDLEDEVLRSIFAEVDISTFKFNPYDMSCSYYSTLEEAEAAEVRDKREFETVDFEDLCHCINCNSIIHVDDVGNNQCSECGCSEPEHPAPEDIDYWELYEEYQ